MSSQYIISPSASVLDTCKRNTADNNVFRLILSLNEFYGLPFLILFIPSLGSILYILIACSRYSIFFLRIVDTRAVLHLARLEWFNLFFCLVFSSLPIQAWFYTLRPWMRPYERNTYKLHSFSKSLPFIYSSALLLFSLSLLLCFSSNEDWYLAKGKTVVSCGWRLQLTPIGKCVASVGISWQSTVLNLRECKNIII